MASLTLKRIMNHWTAPLPESKPYDSEKLPPEPFVLPFNVEAFCHDNDEILKEALELVHHLKGRPFSRDMAKRVREFEDRILI